MLAKIHSLTHRFVCDHALSLKNDFYIYTKYFSVTRGIIPVRSSPVLSQELITLTVLFVSKELLVGVRVTDSPAFRMTTSSRRSGNFTPACDNVCDWICYANRHSARRRGGNTTGLRRRYADSGVVSSKSVSQGSGRWKSTDPSNWETPDGKIRG